MRIIRRVEYCHIKSGVSSLKKEVGGYEQDMARLNVISNPSFGYDTLMSQGYSFPDTKAPTLISGDIYITK